MDSDSLVSTIKVSGIDHNYSVDSLKIAAFTDELNNVLYNKNNEVVYYLQSRIKEIKDRYK
jgi:hypothetical protein